MLKRIILFSLPFILWIFLLREFLSGAIPLNMDTNTIYGVAKYYFNNVLNGVVPLWEPFIVLGRPFYAISICNLFNPIMLLMPILKLLGLNYHLAFNVYIAVYFWVGCIGFYFLAKQLFQEKIFAYIAYVALMFSSLGVSIFTQLTFLEILVPTIWFFYFLIAFAKTQNKGNFVGLCFSIMIVLSSYLPFYFLTALACFVVVFGILYTKDAWGYLRNSFRFKMKHKVLTFVCALGVIAAAGPLLAFKVLDSSGDVVSPGRHCQYTSAQECYDRTMSKQGGMFYEEVARSGGFGERVDLGYLFSHSDKITYGSDSLFFVPVWIYIILGISVFLTLNRLTVLLVGMMALIGLIALGDSAPLHHFLFDHLFFFKYFRNLFFLGIFLIPLVILLAIWQLKALLEIKPHDASTKKAMVVGIALMHGACFIFLRQFDGVMPIAWITLGLSALCFAVYYLGGHRWDLKIWAGVFALVLVMQPIAVIHAYSSNAAEFKCVLPTAHVTPQFAWVRPDKPATSICRIYQFVPYEDFWYAMSMTDAPAKVGYPQAASRYAFDLSQQQGDQAVAAYAKYKIYFFDAMNAPGISLAGPTPELSVMHFDVNTIVFKANFSKEKYLVYNDAFTQSWHGLIDGQEVKLERVNGAFKGIHVPAGEHLVEMRYEPPGGRWVYIGTTVTLLIFLILTLRLICLRK